MKYFTQILLIPFFLLPAAWTSAQNVGINGTGAAPDGTAMLDVAAPDKGLLIPRLALTGTSDVTTIPGSATSLLVYNTATVSDVTPGFYYWDGTRWVRLTNSLDDWSTTGNAGTSIATNFLGTTDSVDFAVRANNYEAIRVRTTGRVGIGLTVPLAKLHVSGSVRVGPRYPANTGSLPGFGDRLLFCGGPAGPSFNNDNSDPLWMARYNISSDRSELRLNIGDNCASSDAFVIQAGGYVCSANTVQFRFNAQGNAYKPGGGSWAALSDRRLKTDIRDFEDGLAVLRRIRPVRFRYNGEDGTPATGAEYVGVIAQEVIETAPYTVSSLGEYLSVDPSAFTYILINSVQEQQVEIEGQQEQIDGLKAENETLRRKLEAISADVQALRDYVEPEVKR